MLNRWCHLCPGGLGVFSRERKVFASLGRVLWEPSQQPTEQQKQHVVQTCCSEMFFFSRRFWTHIGPLWIYLFVLRSCRCFISPPANAFQGPLHLLGTKKGLNTENAGVLRQNGRFNKMPQVFWYGCHFERCRSWWSLEVGKPGRGRRLGKCQPVEREQASGESPQQKRVRFCFQVGERLKKSPRYG